jgi:hypothetical protein
VVGFCHHQPSSGCATFYPSDAEKELQLAAGTGCFKALMKLFIAGVLNS